MPHSRVHSTMIALDDVVIHVVTAGDPAGTPVVFLHGFTGSAKGWGQHIETIAAAGMRVIAFDLLGHGASSAPTDPLRYGIDHCQSDIIQVLDILGVQSGMAWLLGYSMGGRIALNALFSGYFRGGILESASPGIADERERITRRASDAALADRIEREGVPAFVEYWENIPLFASQKTLPLAVRQRLREQRLHNAASGLAGSLRGVGTGSQPALHARLTQLRVPILILVGCLDAKFAAIGKEMQQALPHAAYTCIEGAGHAVHLEQPDEFDQQVKIFLSNA